MCRILISIVLLGASWSLAGQQLKFPQIELHFPINTPDSFRNNIIQWVNNAARAMDSYYGGFPLKKVNINIHIRNGSNVNGRAYGFRNGRIELTVGSDTPFPVFAKDWVMAHELIHLAMPVLDDNHRWLMEGISTYVEPIARYKSGELTRQQVLQEWWDNFPKGLPKYNKGLNDDGSWGARYWGGALFCFLADSRLRRASNNQIGLEQALTAVANTDVENPDWSIQRWLDTVDKATDSHVVSDLYQQMAVTPIHISLAELWVELGVRRQSGVIVLDESVPGVKIIKNILR